MTKIKELADEMKDELCSAKDYAEKYIEKKANNENEWASRFKSMAQDELKHASSLHEMIVQEINKLSNIYIPPQSMMDKWDIDHKHYVEKHSWIEKMLEM